MAVFRKRAIASHDTAFIPRNQDEIAIDKGQGPVL